jgi:hypothetical protein
MRQRGVCGPLDCEVAHAAPGGMPSKGNCFGSAYEQPDPHAPPPLIRACTLAGVPLHSNRSIGHPASRARPMTALPLAEPELKDAAPNGQRRHNGVIHQWRRQNAIHTAW